MANKNNVPSPVLPLAPLEYDVQYFNNLIRLLNYYIEQQDNPGTGIFSRLELNDGDADGTDVIIDVKQNSADLTYFWIKELPTSPTGLQTGQMWVDTTAGNTLKLAP